MTALDRIASRAAAVDAALAEVDRRDASGENYPLTVTPSLVARATEDSVADVEPLLAAVRAVEGVCTEVEGRGPGLQWVHASAIRKAIEAALAGVQ